MSQKRVAFEQDLDSDKHALLNRSSELFYTTSEIGPVASVVNFGNETSQTRQRPVYDRASSASPYASYPAHASESSQTGDISNNAPKGYGLGIGSTSPGRNVRNTSISSMPSPAISFILDDGLQDGRESPVSTWSKAQSFSSARPLYHKAALSEDGDRASTTRSTKSYAEFSPRQNCPSKKQIWQSPGHHISVILLILSVFSTIFSGLYLGIAVARPRYGNFVAPDHGNLSYSSASVLAALFAKLIELTFVTVFVAFIGQVISRRAFIRKGGRGITLAELSMRAWILQPGTIFTHFEGVKYAIVTVLGVLAMTAAVVAVLYTTASDALVSPQLKFGAFKPMDLQRPVSADFGSVDYIQSRCQTPAPDNGDPHRNSTCLAIELAALSYHNYMLYLNSWSDDLVQGKQSSDLKTRPLATALLNDNITVTGSWIEVVDMNTASSQQGRLINNVTLAMPHAGVVDAAQNPANNIPQPKSADGFGAFELHASVVAPAINVLCANMSAQELAPLVYNTWEQSEQPLNTSLWPLQAPLFTPGNYLNRTVVDDIFGWGPKYARVPPTFAKLPIDYNTILNGTGNWVDLDTIYVLGKGPPSVDGYMLCALRATISSDCSTFYASASSGSSINSTCEDATDPYQFSKMNFVPPTNHSIFAINWAEIGQSWASSLSLGDGLVDADASISNLLTQFIPTTAKALDPQLPSMAEALAVMAGSTLLLSAKDAPFVDYNNYSTGLPVSPGQETFKAGFRDQQYASGANSGYQNGFYAVLLFVFLGNVLVLFWFCWHRGLVTDFSDPPNMFALLINSPPSYAFAGSCGGGPAGDQYNERWFINADGDHIFIEHSGDDYAEFEDGRDTDGVGLVPMATPIAQTYAKLSKRSSIF